MNHLPSNIDQPSIPHETGESADLRPGAQVRKRPGFFAHLHPPTIPAPQARFGYTLAAGGLAVFCSIVLLLTGILEMFFYVPIPEQAGLSVQTITYLVPYGGLVRGLHYWSAQALVVIAAIHLLRVLLTGAYSPPRRQNYLIGIALLLTVVLLDFTGYMLRWDEGIRWALMVGTNLIDTIPLVGHVLYGFIVGGESPGATTLIRFYAWHIFGLTLLMSILIGWHIFRVRRDVGIAVPPPEQRRDQRRITRIELLDREVIVMLIASSVLVLTASLIPAPIEPPIEAAPAALAADVRAPWFFLWVQQLLRLGDAFWLGVVVPLGVLGLLALLPYLRPNIPEAQLGGWFPPSGRSVQIISILIVLAWLILTVLELSK
jgi:quinol-cytochrome oxidoreductase complex cytochrome b subunit